MDRRQMLWQCLAAAGAAQAWGAVTYHPLNDPVVLPMKALPGVWTTAFFQARCTKTAPDGSQAKALLRGIALRLPGRRRVGAFCLNCPHELCELKLHKEPPRCSIPPPPPHPLLVCPCHFSVFDPLAEGAALRGPATRGAYRFHLEIRKDRVEIDAVEQEALS